MKKQLTQTKDLFEKEYHISSFSINTRGQLGLYALLNLLQDISHYHANILGFGYKDMVFKKIYWVLTRQKLVMTKWPKWEQIITIKTWIRPESGAFANRDFCIYLNDEKIGESTTSWLTINAETRKPQSVDLSEITSGIKPSETVHFNAEKIIPEKSGLDLTMTFEVRNSDIDQNNHVNNTNYAKWILDAIPFELHHQHELISYEINFLNETKLKDSIHIKQGQQIPFDENTFHVQFQGLLTESEKPAFIARLGAKKCNV